MSCGYVRGGRQCGRPVAAMLRHTIPGHPSGSGASLCLDHLLFVIGVQARIDRAGTTTVIEWR